MIDRNRCHCADISARLDQLQARLDALTNPAPRPIAATLMLRSGALVDLLRCTVERGEIIQRITPGCWRMLDRLASHSRQSVEQLACWYFSVEQAGPDEIQAIRVTAHRLRKQLATVGCRDDLLTTSQGYVLEVAP